MPVDRATYSAPLARSALAYVLAGGRGTRLMELTENRAKPAVYFGGKIAHRRLRAVQRAQFRHPPNRGGDPIQGPQPHPPSAARLELPAADAQRELRHPARVAARCGKPVVHGHRRRRVPEHRHRRRLRARVHRRAGRRSRVQDGLRAHARSARERRRRRHRRLHGSLRRRRAAAWASCRSTRRIASWRSRRSRSIRRSCRTSRAACSRAWASTYSGAIPARPAAARRRRIRPPSRDFGRDIIPWLVKNAKAVAHRFERSCVRSPDENETYWRDVGTLDAYFAANIDLTDVVPELDLYDSDWPIWTYAGITPPAKFVHDVEGRRGMGISSLVSGGCIVSGSTLHNSLLCEHVHVHSWSDIDHCVLLPYVDVGRNVQAVARHRRCGRESFRRGSSWARIRSSTRRASAAPSAASASSRSRCWTASRSDPPCRGLCACSRSPPRRFRW